jgi:DNA-directed RNA polymerase subunit RPC12/RpoP
MSPVPPEPARRLLLELARREAETRRCPGCGGSLAACGLELREVELDRALVGVTCPSCGRQATVVLRPEPEEGRAEVR